MKLAPVLKLNSPGILDYTCAWRSTAFFPKRDMFQMTTLILAAMPLTAGLFLLDILIRGTIKRA
jgi:hypothetical protein